MPTTRTKPPRTRRSLRLRRSPVAARAEILRAAEAVVGERAFTALTVDDVMRRTGMTRSAFYHYFSGLDELAVGLLEQFEHDIRASVDPWLRGQDDGDPIEATVTHLTAMFEVLLAHRTLVQAVTEAAGGYPTVYQQWQSRVLDYFIHLTTDFIRREVARGRSQATDPEKLAQALILMNHAVATDDMARDARGEPARAGRVLAGIWNAAIYQRTS